MGCNSCIKKLCSVFLDCENLGTIKTPFINTSLNDLIYKIRYDFLGACYVKESIILSGENVEFKNLELNESYCYSFEVLDSNDNVLSDGEFNRFDFCTKKQYL
jgi:hypothetical protein